VARTGPLAGTRYQLRDGVTRVGRSAESDIIVHGPNTATVSGAHLEIECKEGVWAVRDMGSTNGTFVNGQRVTEAELTGASVIRLGSDGPEFGFSTEDAPADVALDSTLVIPDGVALSTPQPKSPSTVDAHERFLRAAVRRARLARMQGLEGQTITVMRDMLHRALKRDSRRWRKIVWTLAAALALTSAVGGWKILRLRAENVDIDRKIHDVEARLDKTQDEPETERLISQLTVYESEAQMLRSNLLYRMTGAPPESFVMQEIRALMVEFGAEVYSVPPDFVDQVNAHIQRYLGPDRPNMTRALREAKGQIAAMQRILVEEKLPPDFAYVPVVESTLSLTQSSAAGAAGPWQLTAITARSLGLRVDKNVDERKELRKSTRAAANYLRDLLLDFGTGSSVMLALAAYNLGPTKMKQVVMRSVKDPFKQRNFWYLYRARALPPETREFVPKVFAVIIIGRNPQRYGF